MIIAKEHIKTGFSADDAERLKQVVDPLFDKREKVTIDFSEVKNFTSLFFNMVFGMYMVEIGPEQYVKFFQLHNLNEVGKSSYRFAVDNATEYYHKTPEDRAIHDSIISELSI